MAIIQCYECGADVSDQAQSCPHCGAVQSKWARVKAEQKAKTQAAIEYAKTPEGKKKQRIKFAAFAAIAVVATPAAAVIAAVVSSASAPVFLGLGFIDNQGSSLKFLAVHGFNCGAH